MHPRISNPRTLFAMAAGLLVCGFALACGSGDAPAPKPAATPQAPAERANPAEPQAAAPNAPSGESGEAFATEGVIPEGYPSDVPVYPGSEPGPAMSMPGLGVFATFESADSVDKILSHYRDELAKGGWSVQDSAEGGVDAEKGSRSVQVRARPSESGRTEIAINVSNS